MAKLVSNVYGDALFDLGLETNQLDSLLEEVKGVSEVIQTNTDLAKLMNHPKITKEEKIKLIEDIFTGRVSREMVGLMRLLVEKGHFNEMVSVFDYYENRVKEHNNVGTAYVTSAMPLREEQKKAIEKRLLETTKYVKFEMHFNVDAALIGGMTIRIGDRIVDSSVKNKLENLTRELQNIQLKAGE